MPRRLLPPALLALAVSAAYGWAMLTGYWWTDYELANLEAFRALVSGNLDAFMRHSPIEGPSLLLRAPWALLTDALGGGDLAIYRVVAIPGLLAGCVLGLVLLELRRTRFPQAKWPLVFLLLAAGNPITLRALEMGHPEELFGAASCVLAVLAALHRRPWLAAVLLGLAIANKAWAVLAIGPVLLALPERRLAVLLLAGAITALFVAPFLLHSADSRAAIVSAGGTDAVFQPWQAWWFLGDPSDAVRGFNGLAKEDWRAAPAWISQLTHPLIVVLMVPASLAWWWRRGAGAGTPDVLLLLAALLLMRCVLDVANNVYYHLPFLLALLGWETLRSARPPVFSLLGAVAVWVTFEELPPVLPPDAQSVAYVVWAVPALVVLTWAAFRRPRAGAPAPDPAEPAAVLPAPAPVAA